MTVENYELLELIAEDEERESFRARDLSNFQEVLVHTLRSSAHSSQSRVDLAQLAESLFNGRRPAELLFAGEREGRFYIVTNFEAGCRDIRKWLEQQSARPLVPNSSEVLGRAAMWKVPPIESGPPSEPGNFTMRFRAAMETEQPVQDQLPEKPSQDFQGELASAEPGNFTRLFSTVQANHEGPPPELTEALTETATGLPAPPDASQQRSREPGDFTQMFQTHRPDPTDDTATEATPDSLFPESMPPSDFTRKFGSVSAPEENGFDRSVDRSTDAARPAETRKPEIFDFTSRFAASSDPKPRQDDVPHALFPPVSTPPPKEFERFPFTETASTSPVNSGIPSAIHDANESATKVFRAQKASEPVVYEQTPGPSDYTQAIRIPTSVSEPPQPEVSTPQPEPQSQPEPVAAKSAPAPIPEKTSPPPYLLFIIVMNVLFLAAVVLVVYFALKK